MFQEDLEIISLALLNKYQPKVEGTIVLYNYIVLSWSTNWTFRDKDTSTRQHPALCNLLKSLREYLSAPVSWFWTNNTPSKSAQVFQCHQLVLSNFICKFPKSSPKRFCDISNIYIEFFASCFILLMQRRCQRAKFNYNINGFKD